MLKYQNIIGQLSLRDKLRILSNIGSLTDKRFKALGIPGVKLGYLDDYRGSDFPSASALANSMDWELVFSVADALMKKMRADGINLAVIPGAKVKLSPGSDALSEDLLTAISLTEAYIRAAENNGLSVCLSGLCLTEEETRLLDSSPNKKFLLEYIVRPYADLARRDCVAAILVQEEPMTKNYENVNSYLVSEVAGLTEGAAVGFVCPRISSGKCVARVASGVIAMSCPELVLEAALHRYEQLSRALGRGSVTEEERDAEVRSGNAISSDAIDAAVDRALAFAFSLRKQLALGYSEPIDSALSLRAVRDSAVLVKNRSSLLPLKKMPKNAEDEQQKKRKKDHKETLPIRVGIVGDIAFVEDRDGLSLADRLRPMIEECGAVVSDACRGYDLDSDYCEDRFRSAHALAERSDILLLFLGLGKERERYVSQNGRIAIPANQQALLDSLRGCFAKVVAILPSEYLPDPRFDGSCDAIIYAPLDVECSATALISILFGDREPRGRLASSVCLGSDEVYAERRAEIMHDGKKVGPFVGYRYYDAADLCPGYPFGHGLGFGELSYGDLVISSDSVSFTVKNSGRSAAGSLVEVYVGMADPSVARPKKELVGTARVELAPREKMKVTVPFELPSVYDDKLGGFFAARGAYAVYVGTSVSDIRLTGEFFGGSVEASLPRKDSDNYVAAVQSGLSDDFKLEAKMKKTKKSAFNFAAGGLSLVLAITLKLYCTFSGADALFFDMFSIFLALIGLCFFVREAIGRRLIECEEREQAASAAAERFADADVLPFDSAEALFAEEFDRTNIADTVEEKRDNMGSDAERMAHIDAEQSFGSAVDDFMSLALEKGMRFERETVERIFSSIASSRMLVVRKMSDGDLRDLMLLLGSYFESGVYIDAIDGMCTCDSDLLFRPDATGNAVKTNLITAIEAARCAPHLICFAALANMSSAAMSACLSQLSGYAGNPTGNSAIKATVSIYGRSSDHTCVMPCNLWLVVNLADSESVADIPSFVTDIATVGEFPFERVAPTEKAEHMRRFSYYQLEYLVERAISAHNVGEDAWKCIDRLAEYVASRSDYRIGNKTWLALERFVFACMACGGDAAAVLDRAIAAKLMPGMIASVGEANDGERSLSDMLDEIFGDTQTDACRAVIRDADAGVDSN